MGFINQFITRGHHIVGLLQWNDRQMIETRGILHDFTTCFLLIYPNIPRWYMGYWVQPGELFILVILALLTFPVIVTSVPVHPSMHVVDISIYYHMVCL